MANLDLIFSYTLIFSPLAAAFFLTLVPTFDIQSKNTISRFFVLINFLVFVKIFINFFYNVGQENIILIFELFNSKTKFSINFAETNIFLFGILSLMMLGNMYLFELNDTKSNIHQAMPFFLAFIANICFGQNDLRLALPVLSLSTFILYFLISFSHKRKKGTAIFHMGVFLFFFDALALVILQYNNSDYSLTLLIPGLSRMGVAIFTPFMKRFFSNVDESDGAFLVAYLQITGFFLLLLAKSELTLSSSFISLTVGILCALSSFFIAVTAIASSNAKTLPYYFLSFYSSIVITVLFFSKDKVYWYLAVSLFITNIVIFFHNSKIYYLIYQFHLRMFSKAKLRAIWFLSLSLLLGIPGIGIGSSLWPLLYTIARDHFVNKGQILLWPWQFMIFFWGISLVLLALAIVLSLRAKILIQPEFSNLTILDQRHHISEFFFISPLIVVLLSWLIPIVIFFTAKAHI